MIKLLLKPFISLANISTIRFSRVIFKVKFSSQTDFEEGKIDIYVTKHEKSNKITGTITVFLSVLKCILMICMNQMFLWSNDLVVKALDSQSRGSMFKTTGWLQGQLSLSSLGG